MPDQNQTVPANHTGSNRRNDNVTAGAGTSKKRLNIKRSETLIAFLFLLPAILHFGLFKYYPTVYSFLLSLFRGRLVEPFDRYVGLMHYQYLMGSSYFWQGIFNVIIYTLWRVPIGAVLSLALALLLVQNYRGRVFFRVAWYIPCVISLVAQVQIFVWLYEPRYGLLNFLLSRVGVAPVNWLYPPDTAMLSLILLGWWGAVPFAMVIYMAALGTIPAELYEAAEIDGAGVWVRFWRVTLPMLMPTTFFVLITQTILAMNLFEPIYLMTGGGPMGSTTMPGYQIYEAAFEFNMWGRASGIAVIFFFIILAFTYLQYKGVPESFT